MTPRASLTVTDANSHATKNDRFGPNGYPQIIIDAKQKSTTYAYYERGKVLKVTDAHSKKTTQKYDTFGRPTENKAPVNQAGGVHHYAGSGVRRERQRQRVDGPERRGDDGGVRQGGRGQLLAGAGRQHG